MSTLHIATQLLEVIRHAEGLQDKYRRLQTNAKNKELGQALSDLLAALIHINTLLRSTTIDAARRHAANAILFLLDQALSILVKHIPGIDLISGGDIDAEPSSRFVGTRKDKKQAKERSRICQIVQSLTSDLSYHADLLEMPNLTIPSDCTCFVKSPDPKHQRRHVRNESVQQTSMLTQDFHADQIYQDRHTCFAGHTDCTTIAELPGSFVYTAELPGSLATRSRSELAEANAFFVPGRLRAPAVHDQPAIDSNNVENHTQSASDTSTELNETPEQFRVPCGSTSPPPPYSLHDISSAVEILTIPENAVFGSTDSASPSSPTILPHAEDENTPWIDPITLACRRIMQEQFPTTTPTLFEKYATFRRDTRDQPRYRWYFNFRYMSMVLEPDLPCQVFLVKLSTRYIIDHRQRTAQTEFPRILAYLLGDCIVFARSPFAQDLPDPNCNISMSDRDADNMPLTLHGGLEILEPMSIRFCRLKNAVKQDKKLLLLECSPGVDDVNSPYKSDRQACYAQRISTLNNTTHFRIKFRTTCQRQKVFENLKSWLEPAANKAHEHVKTSTSPVPDRNHCCHRCEHQCAQPDPHERGRTRHQHRSHYEHCTTVWHRKAKHHRQHRSDDVTSHDYTPRSCIGTLHNPSKHDGDYWMTEEEEHFGISSTFVLPVHVSTSGGF